MVIGLLTGSTEKLYYGRSGHGDLLVVFGDDLFPILYCRFTNNPPSTSNCAPVT